MNRSPDKISNFKFQISNFKFQMKNEELRNSPAVHSSFLIFNSKFEISLFDA